MAQLGRTLANFETRIRRYLKESTASTSFWSESFIRQIFNVQYRRRCAQLVMAYEGWFISVATRNIESGKDRYALPDGFERLQKIEIVRTDGSTVPLRRFERHEEINPAQGADGDQYNPSYRMLGNGFVLEPKPNSNITSGLRIEYAGLPAELTSDGDFIHPSFPGLFDELLVIDSVISAFDAEGIQESGLVRSLLRSRTEMEDDWERFIDARTVSRQRVTPFIPLYFDA